MSAYNYDMMMIARPMHTAIRSSSDWRGKTSRYTLRLVHLWKCHLKVGPFKGFDYEISRVVEIGPVVEIGLLDI